MDYAHNQSYTILHTIPIAHHNLGPVVDWVHANMILLRTHVGCGVLSSMVSIIKLGYLSIALLHGGGVVVDVGHMETFLN